MRRRADISVAVLGWEDSNLRMAESKSSFFRILINGHSEKSREFGSNSIRGLADISECEARSQPRDHQPEPADDDAYVIRFIFCMADYGQRRGALTSAGTGRKDCLNSSLPRILLESKGCNVYPSEITPLISLPF
jgi:hypothetical protein